MEYFWAAVAHMMVIMSVSITFSQTPAWSCKTTDIEPIYCVWYVSAQAGIKLYCLVTEAMDARNLQWCHWLSIALLLVHMIFQCPAIRQWGHSLLIGVKIYVVCISVDALHLSSAGSHVVIYSAACLLVGYIVVGLALPLMRDRLRAREP